MRSQNIAFLGLNRATEDFISKFKTLGQRGVNIVGIVELESELMPAPRADDISLLTVDALVALGEGVDIILDLSGQPELRAELRRALFASNNRHTVIAPEAIARLIWAMACEQPFPTANMVPGY